MSLGLNSSNTANTAQYPQMQMQDANNASGINQINGTNEAPKAGGAQNIQPENNIQEAQPKLQSQPSEDIYVPQNAAQMQPKSKSKLFLALAVLGIGAGITAIIMKFKGKKPSSKETKALADAAKDVVGSTGAKTEAQAQNTAEETGGKAKNSIFKRAKEKFNSLKEEAKKGYEEGLISAEAEAAEEARIKQRNKHHPAQPVKPKKPSVIMREKIAAALSSFETSMPSLAKISDEARNAAKLSNKAGNDALAALENKTKLDGWVKKTIADFSSAEESTVKNKKLSRKMNIFNTEGPDRWSYNENYSKSLSKKKIKIGRRVEVKDGKIKVAINNVKDTKNGTQSISELFDFDKTTGQIEQYIKYNTAPGTVNYAQSLTIKNGADGNPAYYELIKGFENSNGVNKIAKKTEFSANFANEYENMVYLADGTESCSKIINYNRATGDILHYGEGYRKNPDDTFEYLKKFDPTFGVYREKVKVFNDGSEEAASKIEFSPDKKILSREQGCKLTAAGDKSADIRVEYSDVDGVAKTYYENYKQDAAGRISYTLKAVLNPNGKWVRA